jgi:proteasome lid subunit RPN8/RPN11
MIAEVAISQQLLETILENARSVYPREVILLLRGKVRKDRAEITDIIIPPFATHGKGFSSFPLHALPMDLSLIGSVHSHPSGNPLPSVEDLNHSFGRFMMIVAYPFSGKENVAVYNRSGEAVALELNK